MENNDPRKQSGAGEDLGVDEKGNARKIFVNLNGTTSVESNEEHIERIKEEKID